MRAVCPAHGSILDLIILRVLVEEDVLWSSALRNYFRAPVTFPPYILLFSSLICSHSQSMITLKLYSLPSLFRLVWHIYKGGKIK